ncbi:hypothetical protein [Streptomyces albireticuli]|uniref:hypothetical protein n=1 Tax=Streptomyces albireticuli TaxID=1940 RepID=UPI001473D13E|nr:hypothetical protein [Streptomyces albireticuli]MCD9145407.1 hypothetical protein [Streptomyces albireticuli]MCD9165028.1 hypothetical protein [Streptomyces albireticuli]MCD9195381.1 hypothetical protein [Streptomyces albireticuli]
MLTDDGDLVVVAGMVAAGKADATVLDALTADTPRGQRPFEPGRFGIPPEEFSRFQRLWYHFKVPYARASLVWWHLFCLALRHDDRVDRALLRMTERLGALADGTGAALPRAAGAPGPAGVPGGTVVVTDDESADLGALTAAVRLGVPLLAVADAAAAREAGRARGLDVRTAGAPAAPGAADRPGLWLGPPPALGHLPRTAALAWAGLPAGERDELLATFERRVSSIERVRFLADETAVDNRGVVALVAECRKAPVEDWPDTSLVLMTLLWCWQEAGFVLQELNQSFLSFPALALFLVRKSREYAARLPDGVPGDPAADAGRDPEGVVGLARGLARLRTAVEERYERCLHFDGSNWERREFLLPLSEYRRVRPVPEELCAHLHDRIGAELPGRSGNPAEWDRFLELALEAGSSPTRVIQEIAHWAADAEDLPVDLAIFTVPHGRKLDQPWTMEFTDLFCYTGFRTGFRPEDFGIAANRVVMYNVIAQRMRYNAVKKAQNYAPVMRFPPQGFNLPDIAVAEDANHGGHTAAGIRLACRLPITVTRAGTDWNGLADVRLNRSAYHRDNRFLPRDMILGHRYTQWAKGVADATYRRGLHFEEKWTDKVKDLDI